MTKKKGNTSEPQTRASDQPIFFHGTKEKYGAFSQWYRSDFTVSKAEICTLLGHPFETLFPGKEHGDVTFGTAEQFMMYCKAIFFRDIQTAEEILFAKSPMIQKALGRSVANFTDEAWDTVKFEVVELASQAKFGQDPKLKALMLETGSRELIEAAARDRIWGIGFGEKTARAMTSRKEWGQNLLGKALMSARDKLRNEDQTNPSAT